MCVCVCVLQKNGTAPCLNYSDYSSIQWIINHKCECQSRFIKTSLTCTTKGKNVTPFTSSLWVQFNTRGNSNCNEYFSSPQFTRLSEWNIYNDHKKALRPHAENQFLLSLSPLSCTLQQAAANRIFQYDIYMSLICDVTHHSIIILFLYSSSIMANEVCLS